MQQSTDGDTLGLWISDDHVRFHHERELWMLHLIRGPVRHSDLERFKRLFRQPVFYSFTYHALILLPKFRVSNLFFADTLNHLQPTSQILDRIPEIVFMHDQDVLAFLAIVHGFLYFPTVTSVCPARIPVGANDQVIGSFDQPL